MTNKEAYAIIQERIELMVNNEDVQKVLIKMKLDGNTEDQCRDWLQKAAIASLMGI